MPRKTSEPDRTDVQRQLAVLFGESMIGPWPEHTPDLERGGRVRRRRPWLWRLAALALIVGVAAGTHALVTPGLERRSAEDRGQLVERLQMSIEDGHVEHAAELVDLIQGQDATLDPDDPHFDEVLRAHAAAYRYHDAKGERVALILPHLRETSGASTSISRLVARYTVLSREERARHLGDLERLQRSMPGDAEIHYLVASARAQKGDVAGAREAYGRSEALAPAWLGHRFEQWEFERQQGNSVAAAEAAAGMLRSAPNSPWSRFAASLSAIAVPPLLSDAAAPATSPVQVHRLKLVQAAQAAAQGDSAQAERLVDAAVAAIHGEPPFLLDAFDYLLDHRAFAQARRLSEASAWPKGSPIASSKQRALTKAVVER